MAHAVLSRIPHSALSKLPTPIALRVRALSQQLKAEMLPTVADTASPQDR